MENIMSKLGRVATNTCRCAAEATGKLAREIKLKAQMADDKAKVRNLYEEIGKKIYEKHLLDEKVDLEIDLDGDISMLDILSDEIENIRMEILNLKDLKQCPKCFYEIDSSFNYCPNCGYEQNEKENKEDSNSSKDNSDVKKDNHKQNDDEKQENLKDFDIENNDDEQEDFDIEDNDEEDDN